MADLYDRMVRLVIAEAAELMGVTRDQGGLHADAGTATTRIDELLAHLEQLAAADPNSEILRNIRAAAAQYSACNHQLAALAGADVSSIHFVLADLVNGHRNRITRHQR